MVTEKGFHRLDEMFLMLPGREPVVHEREVSKLLLRPTELEREHQHC